MPDGGEAGAGAEAGGGEEARRGDQLPEENQPAAQVTAGGHHIAEEIKCVYYLVLIYLFEIISTMSHPCEVQLLLTLLLLRLRSCLLLAPLES